MVDGLVGSVRASPGPARTRPVQVGMRPQDQPGLGPYWWVSVCFSCRRFADQVAERAGTARTKPAQVSVFLSGQCYVSDCRL